MQWDTYMVVSGLAAVLLVTLFAVALQWVGPPAWLLISVAVASTFVALLSARGWLYLLALGAAMAAWAALVAGTLVGGAGPPSVQRGAARVTVEPLRTSCSTTGCWAEARLVRCQPLDPSTCPPAGTLLSLATPTEIPLGARVSMLARMAPRQRFRNPHLVAVWPDARPPVRARAAQASELRVEAVSWLSAAILRARGHIRAQLDASLSPPHAGIARALLLGEGNAVESSLNDAIRGAGVSHVLAVSGMHVTVLVGGITALLRAILLRTPLALHWEARRVAAALGALLSPLVASLCGGSPSAVRAALTSTLMFALVALGRRPQALPVSALAILVHVAREPRDALHPGFVLSVAATASLLTAASVHGSSARRALSESLRAWVSTAPFLVLCFGSTSLVAVLANVVLLPLAGLLIPVAVLHLGAACIGLSGALATQAVMEAASGAFVGASRFCASLDPGVRFPPPTSIQLVALSSLAALWLLVRSLRVRALSLAAALAVCALSEWSLRTGLAEGALQIWFLDVGQGDGALVRTGDGKTLLVDAGGRIAGGADPGAESVLPLLRELRIERLDLVVLEPPPPRPLRRSGGGAGRSFRARAVGHGPGGGRGRRGRAAHRAVGPRREGRAYRAAERAVHRAAAFGNASLHVLWPCPGFDEAFDPNDNSFVVRSSTGAAACCSAVTWSAWRKAGSRRSEEPSCAATC